MGLDSGCSPPDFLWRYPVDRALKPYGPIGGDHPTNKELIDYDPFCGIPGEIGRAISRGKPTRARRSGSAAGQFNPDEVTAQDMKQALDNPSLGIKVIDVRSPHEIAAAPISRGKPDEYEVAKVNDVPLTQEIEQEETEATEKSYRCLLSLLL
jgi:hypothetical protein